MWLSSVCLSRFQFYISAKYLLLRSRSDVRDLLKLNRNGDDILCANFVILFPMQAESSLNKPSISTILGTRLLNESSSSSSRQQFINSLFTEQLPVVFLYLSFHFIIKMHSNNNRDSNSLFFRKKITNTWGDKMMNGLSERLYVRGKGKKTDTKSDLFLIHKFPKLS